MNLYAGIREAGLVLGLSMEETIMTIKNPSHPGELIREDVIAPLVLSAGRAADILGVRRATLSDVMNAKASISAEMAFRLEKAFGVSMDLLLRMQAGYDAARMRKEGGRIKVKRFEPELVQS
jgi:addiction module HigA family antidote